MNEKMKAPSSGGNADLVEALEQFLDEARRGEIDGLAVAVTRPSAEIAISIRVTRDSAKLSLIGAINFIKNEICEMLQKGTMASPEVRGAEETRGTRQ